MRYPHAEGGAFFCIDVAGAVVKNIQFDSVD